MVTRELLKNYSELEASRLELERQVRAIKAQTEAIKEIILQHVKDSTSVVFLDSVITIENRHNKGYTVAPFDYKIVKVNFPEMKKGA